MTADGMIFKVFSPMHKGTTELIVKYRKQLGQKIFVLSEIVIRSQSYRICLDVSQNAKMK